MTARTNVFLQAHPEDIYRALDQMFGDEDWLSWEPETILMSLPKDEVPDDAKDKILAVHAVAANSSMVLANAVAFEKVVMAFCNNVCVMDTFQPPYVEELVYSVRQIREIIKLAHPEDGKDAVFHSEVPEYVAATAKFRGWFYLPKQLSFAQVALDRLTGLSEESAKRSKCKKVYDAVQEVYSKMKTRDAQLMLEHDELEDLAEDDMAAGLTRNIVGALLYDPTIVYKKS